MFAGSAQPWPIPGVEHKVGESGDRVGTGRNIVQRGGQGLTLQGP